MLFFILNIIRIFLLGAMVYFLTKFWLTIAYYKHEEKLFVPSVNRVLPIFWQYLAKNPKIAQIVLGKRKNFNNFLDLGAGYATVLINAYKLKLAKTYTGIEYQNLLFFIGWCRVNFYKLWIKGRSSKVKLFWWKKDMYSCSWNKYDFVYLFLTPTVLKKVMPKLKKEAKPGTIILCWIFTLPEMDQYLVDKITMKGIKKQKTLYIYKL